MDSGWIPEVGDAVRTGIAAVQAATPWLRPDASGSGGAPPDGTVVVPGASTAVPCPPGRLVACGRDDVVEELVGVLEREHWTAPQVLHAAGGMGKSTVARLVAQRARERDPRRRVWWISAASEQPLAAGLVSVARELGASPAEQEMIRSHPVAGLGDLADRVWTLLDGQPRRWLLVVDNADDPELLGPRDGTGWIRAAARGLLLVTTRNGSESDWPSMADLREITPLSPEAAAGALTELAPDAGSLDDARALAVRLGCLPLALHMAGVYLGSRFTVWRTFEEYRRAIDREGLRRVVDVSQKADRRAVVTHTWEISVDALVRDGLPQARPLLWLLSCYAPGSRIPADVITGVDPDGDAHPLADLVGGGQARSVMAVIEECLDGLRGLASAGLIDEVGTGDEPRQLEIHPFIGEVTATLLDGGTRVGVEPVLVRDSAVAAIGAAVRRLEPGRAEHWPWFRDLTPHVQRLLTASAEHIGSLRRAELLDCVMRCASSSMWSRAEQHAEQLASAALALGQRLGCAGSEACLRVQHVLGWSLREQERYDEAAATLRHVLSEQVRLPGGMNRPDALHTRHDLAWTRGRQGHWAEAEREFHEVLRLRRAQLRQSGVDQDNADIMHTRCMLAWCVGKQGHWEQAERRYRELAVDRAAILGADHPDTLDTTESLAKTLAWQGNWDTARAEFHRLAQAREDRLGRQHPDTLLAYQLEAYAAGYLAQFGGDRRSVRDAVRRLEDILGTQRSVRGDDHRNTRDTLAFLAVLRRSAPAPGWTEDLPEPMRPGR